MTILQADMPSERRSAAGMACSSPARVSVALINDSVAVSCISAYITRYQRRRDAGDGSLRQGACRDTAWPLDAPSSVKEVLEIL